MSIQTTIVRRRKENRKQSYFFYLCYIFYKIVWGLVYAKRHYFLIMKYDNLGTLKIEKIEFTKKFLNETLQELFHGSANIWCII